MSLEVDWVIVKNLSSSTPLRPDVTNFQGRGMIWWKWANLVICVGFQKLDWLNLEGLVSDETKIFVEVGLVMSVLGSQLRGVTNRV